MKPFKAYVYHIGCEQPKAVTVAEVLEHKVVYTEPCEDGFIGAKKDCVFLTISQALMAMQFAEEHL